jgi:hypothetical protein
MLNFKSFLKEQHTDQTELLQIQEGLLLEVAASSSAESDDKGKLHELLLSKHLHPEIKLPEHHRSESENLDHAGTPQQVHDRLKEKVGLAAYNEIEKHAQQTAAAINSHLKEHGHIGGTNGHHIHSVFWSSNADKHNVPGDHEKTTGVKDVNSNADLIIRFADKNGKTTGHFGVSAKYGSQEPNYRNPGLDAMEKMAGLKAGTMAKHMDAHKTRMDELQYTGSADNRNYQTKIDEMAAEHGIDKIRDEFNKHQKTLAAGGKLKPKEKLIHQNALAFIQNHDALPKSKQKDFINKATMRASTARQSNILARKSIAKDFHTAISEKSPEDLANIIRGAVSPQTHIPHIIAHSKVKDDGTADSLVKHMHSLADEHMSQYDLNTLKPHIGSGTSVTFKAKHLKTGKMMNVAHINIKSSSGAHKGSVGSFKLKS